MDGKEFEIARLNLKPGDVLIAKYRGALSRDVAARIRDQMKDAFPEGVRVFVIDQNLDLSVLSVGAESNVPPPTAPTLHG